MKTKEAGFEGFPAHHKIVRYWQGRPEVAKIFDDAPCCFACRNGVYQWQELQRAHIIAFCHDGSFEPENFVLLCLSCHKEAPMVTDREMFIRWVQKHPHFTQPMVELTEAVQKLESYGLIIREGDAERFTQFLRSRKLRFHPHSTLAEKLRVLIFLLGEYLRARGEVFS